MNCLQLISHIKKSLLLILFLAISLIVSGQITNSGITVGFNASQVRGDTQEGYSKFGLIIGGFTTFKVIDGLEISPIIIFEQLGSTNGFNRPIIKTNYISFPLLIRLNPRLINSSFTDRFSLEAGIVPGVLILAEMALIQISSLFEYRSRDRFI